MCSILNRLRPCFFFIPERQVHYPSSFVSFETATCAACARTHTLDKTQPPKELQSFPSLRFYRRRRRSRGREGGRIGARKGRTPPFALLHRAKLPSSALLYILQCKLDGVVCHPPIGDDANGRTEVGPAAASWRSAWRFDRLPRVGSEMARR